MKINLHLRTIISVLFSIGAVLLIGIGLIACTPTRASNLDLSAKLSELVGVVAVRNNEQDKFNQVNDGFILKAIQQLQTQAESRARLDLNTGSIVRLGQNTIFSLDPPVSGGDEALTHLQLQVGRVWIILNGGTLGVSTPGGIASVRGSYMSVWVKSGSNEIIVCCLEGSCTYQNEGGIVSLTTGQKIISTETNVAPAVQPMDQADIQDWQNNSPESSVIIPQVVPLVVTSTPTLSPTIASTPTAFPDYFSGFDPALIQKCLSYGYTSEKTYNCLLDLSMTITPWINTP